MAEDQHRRCMRQRHSNCKSDPNAEDALPKVTGKAWCDRRRLYACARATVSSNDGRKKRKGFSEYQLLIIFYTSRSLKARPPLAPPRLALTMPGACRPLDGFSA
eukprot:356731-Chlamydomonas_euryale.AAC.5